MAALRFSPSFDHAPNPPSGDELLAFPGQPDRRHAMKPRMLFVDDDERMLELLCAYFDGKGFEVARASNAHEAMKQADENRFNLALLDINLAGENGLQLLGFFKANFPELPVVMFTGMAGDDDLLDQAMARGASGFMRKSDSLDTLFEAIRTYLPKR
jgi:DNA-binding NtrC family response regulator